MGWFSGDSYTEYQGTHHAKVSHELLGGAVAYEAAKVYEDHIAANGRPDNHAQAKEIVAGIVGALTDRFIETKGLDYWDDYQRKRAINHAQDTIYQSEEFQSSYQDDSYQRDTYQDRSYRDSSYQDRSYQDSSYQSSSYQETRYQRDDY